MQGGGNINDFQKKTSARIQLSKAGEYYPGTTDRTLLVTGRVKQILGALSLVFTKLLREGVAPVTPRSRAIVESQSDEVEGIRLSVKLLVPQQLCGIIIGRGGATVKAYSQQTETQIRVVAPEGPAVAINHRIVAVNGTQEAVLKAVALLIIKQAEDPKFASFGDLPISWTAHVVANRMPSHYEPSQYNGTPTMGAVAHHYQQQYYIHGGNANGQLMYPTMFAASPDGLATMTCHFPEELAIAMLGHGQGSMLGMEEIQAHTGVKVSMSRIEGNTGNSGTGQNGHNSMTMAQLTLYGSPEAVSYANYLIQQRLQIAMVQQYPGQYVGPASAYAAGYSGVPPVNFGHYSPMHSLMPSYGVGDDEYGHGARR